MNQKLFVVVLGFLVLGVAGYFISANTPNNVPEISVFPDGTTAQNFDFGDAPDGKPTFYDGSFAQVGQFPSLLADNGARAKKTSEVWLGQGVNAEENSRQVNADEADDGIRGISTSCKPSTIYFFVGIKNPGQATGTAYLNLYADWNKDGGWVGGDDCASEWAIQNFPVDLAKQREEIGIYEIEFAAGKNTKDIWYRGAVTLEEKLNETAVGMFASGEIEDYGPENPALSDEKYYNFFCQPDPLVINHGSQGNVRVVAGLFSEPIFDISFGQNFIPKNDRREVGLWPGNTFVFKSTKKDVDPPERSTPYFVDMVVRFGADGKEAAIKKPCRVVVKHYDVPRNAPGSQSVPNPLETPGVGIPQKTETHPTQDILLTQ